MALSIKNAETEALARELAARTGNSVTGAITDAVRIQLDRIDSADGDSTTKRLKQLHAISRSTASRWQPGDKGDATAWLYDENGLPA